MSLNPDVLRTVESLVEKHGLIDSNTRTLKPGWGAKVEDIIKEANLVVPHGMDTLSDFSIVAVHTGTPETTQSVTIKQMEQIVEHVVQHRATAKMIDTFLTFAADQGIAFPERTGDPIVDSAHLRDFFGQLSAAYEEGARRTPQQKAPPPPPPPPPLPPPLPLQSSGKGRVRERSPGPQTPPGTPPLGGPSENKTEADAKMQFKKELEERVRRQSEHKAISPEAQSRQKFETDIKKAVDGIRELDPKDKSGHKMVLKTGVKIDLSGIRNLTDEGKRAALAILFSDTLLDPMNVLVLAELLLAQNWVDEAKLSPLITDLMVTAIKTCQPEEREQVIAQLQKKKSPRHVLNQFYQDVKEKIREPVI
jgi:hypothetical protein